MLTKLVASFIILGVVVAAEPIRSGLFDAQETQEVSKVLPDVPYLLFDIVKTLVGAKFSALGLGVIIIEWLVSNALVMVLGAAAAVALCKITGKCQLDYGTYVPVAQLKNFVTPENLETAEKFFVSAMEKYAEKKRRTVSSRMGDMFK